MILACERGCCGERSRPQVFALPRYLPVPGIQKRPGKSPAVFNENPCGTKIRYFAAVGNGIGLSASVCK